ncbi:unnamed protein product [Notodromas monacha]|uniref:F-box domain-containing protein n=1 Tax=Notodromas monacha TaxID=399045 RepID=A0A7R9GEX0_9CRUS|nr:unnamed protein product [Notodromas monacha]CAG0918516.1 unnamed protein product [Notodromas monacha]
MELEGNEKVGSDVHQPERHEFYNTIPDSVLLGIFAYLDARSLLAASMTCQKWCRVGQDELLWRDLLRADFHVPFGITPPESWRLEYRRLHYCVPVVLTEDLQEHSHEVLHVTFSHDGRFFVTCSMDNFVHVWESGFPSYMKYYQNMQEFRWIFPQYSQFNEDSTLLLVSGVICEREAVGEIVVFSIEESGLNFRCRIESRPYDLFGAWYHSEYFISGGVSIIGTAIVSKLSLVKASQETESEHQAVMNSMLRFYTRLSCARNILVADCHEAKNTDDPACSKSGFRPSHWVNPMCDVPTVMWNDGPYDAKENEDSRCLKLLYPWDKYLIFTSGGRANVPHVVNIKRVPPLAFMHYFNAGPSLAERVARVRSREEDDVEFPENQLPALLSDEDILAKFDLPDSSFDLGGYIVGMAISPDHRYLYVNVRPWPFGAIVDDPGEPPPIAEQIEVRIIDLKTLEVLGPVLASHKAYSSSDRCCYVFLDACDNYVARQVWRGDGSEEKYAYVWDRRWMILLAKLQHSSSVNAVAFNPVDSEMLVTVSDDKSVKVWRSRRRCAALNVSVAERPVGIELRANNVK